MVLPINQQIFEPHVGKVITLRAIQQNEWFISFSGLCTFRSIYLMLQ